MSIVFRNPMGEPVAVDEEDVIDLGDGTIAAKVGGETLFKVMNEDEVDDPYSMEADMEDQIVSGQLNEIEDMALDNPPKKMINWKNLRLQSAISGERAAGARQAGRIAEATIGRGVRFAMRTIPANQSVRDSDFLLQMATADDWFTYIQKMADNPIDMGAELSASVSPSQRIAVAMFVKEYEDDPGQRNLLRKAVPGADPMEIQAMGRMIYDLMTGRGPDVRRASGYGTYAYDKMFRLCYDILRSMPIKTYNSYTLFQLEADEGGQVFSEVTRNYTPLEVSEVGLVLELRQKLAEYGVGYANMAVSDPQLANEAAALMQKAVKAYNDGDTITVRAILNYLMEAPFYYKSVAADAESTFRKEEGGAIGVRLDKPSNELKKYAYNGLFFLKKFTGDVDPNTGNINEKGNKNWHNKAFEVVKSPFDNTVAGVITFRDKKNSYTFAEGEKLAKKTGSSSGSNAKQLADILEGASENPRGNPRAKGRGKYFHLQLHPKTQLDMKRAQTTASGQGDIRHGRPPKGKDGSQNTWSKGLYNALNSRIKELNAKHRRDTKSRKDKFSEVTVMVHGGTLKKTGNWAPYMIKLPRSHFTTKRLPSGEMTIGLRSKMADQELINLWQRFTDEYGVFVKSATKSEHYRFVPSKKAEHRGAYQEKVRRQTGAAKGTR